MFAVLHITAVDDHLHGYISRYLHQANATVYVGVLSPRVADELQARISEHHRTGSVTFLRSDPRTEVGYRITYHRSDQQYHLREIDGLQLIVRHSLDPSQGEHHTDSEPNPLLDIQPQ